MDREFTAGRGAGLEALDAPGFPLAVEGFGGLAEGAQAQFVHPQMRGHGRMGSRRTPVSARMLASSGALL